MTTLTTTLPAEELALLYAICLQPDEDTPRLVYADWLDETGEGLLQAYAAFIRQHVADARMELQDVGGNDPDDPSRFLAGSDPWKRERAHAHLLAIFREPSVADADQRDSAGNIWATRLFGGKPLSGYSRPGMWERGFPAVVKFGSTSMWEREVKVYERVPVVRTKVNGREPQPCWWTWAQLDQPYAAFWQRAPVHSGRMHACNLPEVVFDRLTVGVRENWRPERRRYYGYREAFADAELAFTDAGRVACGLGPRHKKMSEAGGAEEPRSAVAS